MFNVWQFFPGYSVSLFHKISCGHPLLNRYCIYFWTALAAMIVYIKCIWQIFLFKAYCNFKGAHAAIHLSGTTIISGSHLQGPSIFKGTVFLWMRTCNRLCFQRYRVNLSPVASIHSTNGPFSIIKEQLQPQVLSNLPYFFRTGRVVARRYYNYQL